jgi:hypothetical protein
LLRQLLPFTDQRFTFTFERASPDIEFFSPTQQLGLLYKTALIQVSCASPLGEY